MGYLTTITIYNDDTYKIKNHPKELAEDLYNACLGDMNTSNLFISQKPRHADDHTLYLHAGNTVVDVYDASSEWAVNQFISEMEYHLKRLKSEKFEGGKQN